jgi:hypothetical protein
MFIGCDTCATGASIFTLPLSNTSVASGTLPTATGYFDGLCTDGTGRLFFPNEIASTVAVYNPPVRTGAAPAFTLPIANVGDCTVDANGNLYLLTALGSIGVIPAPVSSSSTVAKTISNADINFADRVAVDPSGDLFVGNQNGTAVNVVEFSSLGAGNAELAKFGAGANSVEGLAIGPDSNLYVSSATTAGTIDVYKPPFSNASAVDHTITIAAATQLDRVAFGPDGNLYVSAPGISAIDVFAPPYTGAAIASTPIANSAGIAFGP